MFSWLISHKLSCLHLNHNYSQKHNDLITLYIKPAKKNSLELPQHLSIFRFIYAVVPSWNQNPGCNYMHEDNL